MSAAVAAAWTDPRGQSNPEWSDPEEDPLEYPDDLDDPELVPDEADDYPPGVDPEQDLSFPFTLPRSACRVR
jgi:hypothetical protein